MKNLSRIADILGTWTSTTHLKANVGSYELMAYFVIHFMPDPMSAYRCSIDGCNELLNRVCLFKEDNPFGDTTCENVENNIVQWSDVVAFMYFGAKVDVGFPFNKHRQQDTGGWIGPFSIILAQNQTQSYPQLSLPYSLQFSSRQLLPLRQETTIQDRYYTRYVYSPSTRYLRMPDNCTLINPEDFTHLMGATAVNETVKVQSDSIFTNDDDNVDPFQKYLGSCDNGNVKPLLPLFRFDFVSDPDQTQENIQVSLKYKLLTMPRPKDFMYDLYPFFQKRFNAANLGFHISGPYCYGNDPNRGYTFDMTFSSQHPLEMLDVVHACVEGLPCLPPAAEVYGYNHEKPPIVPAQSTTVDLTLTMSFIFMAIFSFIIIISLSVMNYRLRRHIRKQRILLSQQQNISSIPVDESLSDIFHPVDESNIVELNEDLYRPLFTPSKEG